MRRYRPLYALRAPTVAFLLLASLAAPKPAHALEVGLQLTLGVGVPIGTFPDGMPVTVDDPTGQFGYGIPNSAYNVLLDASPSAGFSGELALLLGHWYFRAAVSIHSYDTVTAKRFAATRLAGQEISPKELQNIYLGELDAEVKLTENQTIINTRFGVGYRWYLAGEGLLRPFLPMGLGMSLAIIESEPQYGINFHVGAGVDINVALHIDITVTVLYEWNGIFLPDNFQATSAGSAIAAAATSETSVLEAFMESMHTMQFNVGATYRF
jgi:hypothetical protein